jgi:hypothetical protein
MCLLKRLLKLTKVIKPTLSNRTTTQDTKHATKIDENSTSAKIKVFQSDKFSETNPDHNSCPMCWETWSEKAEPSIVVILPCDHPCCAKCLQKFEKMCKSNTIDFQCSLCRFALKTSIIKDIARLVVKQDLFESFRKLSEMLPFNKESKAKLIVSLLVKHLFNVCEVESSLFEMIGLYISSSSAKQEVEEVNVVEVEERNRVDLSHEEKQKYFELARAPVLKLQNELKAICKEIQELSG